jgi:tetratricopeptide (TPR) repeat protein
MVTSRIITGFALALVVLGIGLGACVARADAGHASATTCQADPQPKVVSDARAALAGSPNDLAAQLALIDALIDQGCYRQAVPVLETSLAQRPRSSELQSRMRAVRSMLNEEQFFEGLGTAQETAKFQHDLMRCAKFFDVNACDDALRSKPDDPQIVIAKGDALAHEGRPADAILIYLHAGGLLPPADEAIKMKLSAAEAQREGLAAQCQVSADAAAADACQAALLRGSADEFALLKRRGILLQSFDKPEQALDAFITASVLKQDDKAVALAVVALTDSTGRKDAMALQARGAALLLLNRPTEALQALRQAEALAPTLQGIKAQVAKAEQGSKEEGKRQARLATVQPGSGQSGAGAAAPAQVAAHGPNSPGASPQGKQANRQQAPAKTQPGARVASTSTVTYSNDASAAHTN